MEKRYNGLRRNTAGSRFVAIRGATPAQVAECQTNPAYRNVIWEEEAEPATLPEHIERELPSKRRKRAEGIAEDAQVSQADETTDAGEGA